MMQVFSETRCALGEGPLWHPERKQLFWFDILGKRLLTVEGGKERHWQFDEHVSAAGWIDAETLLMASETGLWRFDIGTGNRELVIALETDNAITRSNDGRADARGGFWIGTMGKQAEKHAGAIYRYYRGELRVIAEDITISNSICFSPDGSLAYWTDTFGKQIMRQPLDAKTGWPTAKAELFVDLRAEGLNPDGSVVDAAGNLWNAQWGASRVACYDADGNLKTTLDCPASQTSCPAFGGDDLTTMYVTTAADGLKEETAAGKTYSLQTMHKGQPEHRVIL